MPKALRLGWSDLAALRGRLSLVDGVFDPLHRGHLAYFEAARALATGPLLCAVAETTQKRPILWDVETRLALVQLVPDLAYVHVKSMPTEALIAHLRPKQYIKGEDWHGQLPLAQVEACARVGTEIHYTPDRDHDSSTTRLEAWAALREAQALQTSLESVAHSQAPPVAWTPVTDYSLEARRAREGEHPRLIRDVLQPTSVLDVGCGPGRLVTLLQELGLSARGVDCQRYPDWTTDDYVCLDVTDDAAVEATSARADVVICREVLEHLTVRQVARAVRNLCRLTTRLVYVTTRFAPETAPVCTVQTQDTLDPTHITLMHPTLLRALFVLQGGRRRQDLEDRLDWQRQGRVLVYEITR